MSSTSILNGPEETKGDEAVARTNSVHGHRGLLLCGGNDLGLPKGLSLTPEGRIELGIDQRAMVDIDSS
jgi:hypothetical protein